MRRALVEYPSSEEETADKQPEQKKRSKYPSDYLHQTDHIGRKLPPLPSSLTVPRPIDNPALHQGRVRTVPHIEGQYAAYIYVPLVLHPKDALYRLIEESLSLSKAHVPPLHPLGKQGDDSNTTQWELHISLSRPLFLRAHQREEFKRAIKRVASSIAPFDASFTAFSELTNDEGTRTFLVLEVGAGHRELRRCLDILAPTLRMLRQKEFYVEPRFHTSIAWALLEKTSPSPDMASFPVVAALDEIELPERASEEQPSTNFQRIPHFPHALVPLLNEAYAAKLSQARTGGFVVDRIAIKIGKDVVMWPFIGMR